MSSTVPHPLTVYREQRQMTLTAFALRANTTTSYMSRIERGAQYPGVATLRRLVAATDGQVTADEIIGWAPGGGCCCGEAAQ